MMKSPLALAFFFILFLSSTLKAQDDLLDIFADEEEEETTYETAAFKATRVILGQSIENPNAGNLNFLIQHQFGNINGGPNEFWGLDQSAIRLGFDYGVNDRLMLGIGRSSFNKTFDGYGKLKILRQSHGKRNMPISLSYFGGAYLVSLPWANPSRDNFFSSRLSYTHQLLIARKINSNLTLQVSPTLVHRNLVDSIADQNDILSMGVSGRFKFNKWMSINAESFMLLPGRTKDFFTNAFSVGIDMETGGHVFQVYISNARGMQEPYFVAQNIGKWNKGDIFIAFNIHRTFVIRRPKGFRD